MYTTIQQISMNHIKQRKKVQLLVHFKVKIKLTITVGRKLPKYYIFDNCELAIIIKRDKPDKYEKNSILFLERSTYFTKEPIN